MLLMSFCNRIIQIDTLEVRPCFPTSKVAKEGTIIRRVVYVCLERCLSLNYASDHTVE